MRQLAAIILWAACFTAIALHYSSGFCVSKVLCEKSSSEEMQSLPPLFGPYSYLSHGRQSFVFESADKKTVLKLFNQTYFQSRWYHFFYFLPQWRSALEEKLSLRRLFYEKSYPLAKKELPEETGILYVHLHATSASLPCLTIIDPSGRRQTIDLNRAAFVIQKKATPYLEHMERVAKQEGLLGLQREIDRWLAFCQKRIALGILDYDHDIWNNVGISEGKILAIDPGKFYPSNGPIGKEALHLEWWKATHRLYKWLLTNNPDAAKYLRDNTLGLYNHALSNSFRSDLSALSLGRRSDWTNISTQDASFSCSGIVGSFRSQRGDELCDEWPLQRTLS